MQLQEVIISIPATKTQSTIVKNIRSTIQQHELRSKEDHVRRLTMQIATLHFMQCHPFIV